MDTPSKSSVALAHLRLSVTNLSEAVEFFEAIGARADTRREGFTVVELRDRTRLQLTQTNAKISSENFLQFDFKVDNIDEARQDFCDKGLNPSQIVRRNPGHDSFTLIGPHLCEVKINSGLNRN